MNFLKDIAGGIVVLFVAAVIGIGANAVRGKSLPLIARIPAAPVEKPAHADEVKADPGNNPAATTAPRDADDILPREIASGEIPIERVRALSEAGKIILVDARGEHEFQEGHIPGAINIPYEKFVDYYENLMDYVPMDANVVCYCRSVTCDLSDNLAQELRLAGYERVLLFRGGWEDWTKAGYPVKTEEHEH